MGQWVGAQGQPKVAYFSKTCPLCDITSRKPPTETENCFFYFGYKTCWIRRGFEQLSSSIAWRVIGLQSFTRKVVHAWLTGFQSNITCLSLLVACRYSVSFKVESTNAMLMLKVFQSTGTFAFIELQATWSWPIKCFSDNWPLWFPLQCFIFEKNCSQQ